MSVISDNHFHDKESDALHSPISRYQLAVRIPVLMRVRHESLDDDGYDY